MADPKILVNADGSYHTLDYDADGNPTSVYTPAPGRRSFLKDAGKLGAKAFTVITHSPKLRALLAGGITAGFAFLGMHVDGDTALAMVTAAAALAGWGPTPQDGGE